MSTTTAPAPVMPWGAPRPPGAPPPVAPGFAFVEERRQFLRLIVRGAWLQFLTFGFYRFWLTTDIRRHLWSHTLVDGEGAEYTGTGRELVFGFLFALAALTPVYLVYFLIGVEAERRLAFASAPLALFLVLFGQFALYRARRYRLTRTIWRGVRFWMTGSGWNYAFRSFLWLLFVIATLGLAYPWRAAALERYKMGHTYYGDIVGAFNASGWSFFKRGVWLWLIAMVPVIYTLSVLAQIGAGGRPSPQQAFTLVGPLLTTALVWAAIWPAFRALEWRWWASGARIGGASMICRLRARSLYGLYLKFAMAASAFLVAMSLIAGLAAFAADAGLRALGAGDLASLAAAAAEASPYATVAAALGLYLLVALAFGVVKRYFLQYRYWALISRNLEMRDVHALDGASVRGGPAHAFGEGLADSLDVGGF